MRLKMKFLRPVMIVSATVFSIILFLALIMFLSLYIFANSPKELECVYGLRIKIINNSDQDLTVIFFPIDILSKDDYKDCRVKQVNIKNGNSETVSYYMGKKRKILDDLMIGAAVWKNSGKMDKSIFQKPPDFVKTLYNPEYEINPEYYGLFSEFIVE